MTEYSHVKNKEINYSIITISNPNYNAQRIVALSVSLLYLHTTTKLPSVGK